MGGRVLGFEWLGLEVRELNIGGREGPPRKAPLCVQKLATTPDGPDLSGSPVHGQGGHKGGGVLIHPAGNRSYSDGRSFRARQPLTLPSVAPLSPLASITLDAPHRQRRREQLHADVGPTSVLRSEGHAFNVLNGQVPVCSGIGVGRDGVGRGMQAAFG